MVKIRKVDGSISKTQSWNLLWILITTIFTVAVTLLPELHTMVPKEVYLGLALFIKSVDIFLRQITVKPMA